MSLYARSPHGLEVLDDITTRHAAASAARSVHAARLIAVAASNARLFAAAVQERADIEVEVGMLMDRYVMRADEARTLIRQLAHDDRTTEAETARTLTMRITR